MSVNYIKDNIITLNLANDPNDYFGNNFWGSNRFRFNM